MASNTKQEELVEEVEKIAQAVVPPPQLRGYHAETDEQKRFDRRVNWKLDLCVISVLALDFLFQGIDKTNIGNAATSPTFHKDAGLRPDDVPNAVSLFSATFIPFMPISTALGRIVGPKRWIPAMMLCWGAITIAHAGMKQRSHLIALRLLLGVFEAGFVPTAYYYIGTLYPMYNAGFRLGLFAGMYAFGAAFASLIAYGVLQITSSQYDDWQILFLLEGGLTLGLAVATYFLLPEHVSTAWMLNPDERAHAAHRLEIDGRVFEGTDTEYVGTERRITMRNVRDAVTDWKKIAIILCVCFSNPSRSRSTENQQNMCATMPVYAFTTFLPLIVKGMGYSHIDANIMSVPPFIV
jgi:MFS family permease